MTTHYTTRFPRFEYGDKLLTCPMCMGTFLLQIIAYNDNIVCPYCTGMANAMLKVNDQARERRLGSESLGLPYFEEKGEVNKDE